MSVETCTQCAAEITWAMTVYGRLLPFNHPPIPAAEDFSREGWAPGTWPVRGRRKVVFAPITMSSLSKQERVVMVVLLHACPASAFADAS